jgi:hypothetical protein
MFLIAGAALAETDVNTGCIENLRLPDAPTVTGTATVSFFSPSITPIRIISTEAHSPTRQEASSLLRAVIDALNSASYSQFCVGKTVTRTFQFGPHDSSTAVEPGRNATIAGTTIPGATVTLSDPDRAGQIMTARADANGRFVLPPVPPHNYELTFSAAGFRTATTLFPAAAGEVVDIGFYELQVVNIGGDEVTALQPLPDPPEPIPATVCDLGRGKYNQRIVQVRGQYRPATAETPAVLVDTSCQASIALLEDPGGQALAAHGKPGVVTALGRFEYLLVIGGRMSYQLTLQLLSDQ